MAWRNKRPAMREGPALRSLHVHRGRRSGGSARGSAPGRGPRYGREDPAAEKAEADAAPVEPSALAPASPPRAPSSTRRARGRSQRLRRRARGAASRRERPSRRVSPSPASPSSLRAGAARAPPVDDGSPPSRAPERLKRVFAEEPRPRDPREDFLPRSPRYVPRGARLRGARPAVNRTSPVMQGRRRRRRRRQRESTGWSTPASPGSSSWPSTPIFSPCSSASPTSRVHIGDEQTRGLGAGADPEVGHRSAFEE